MRTHVAALRGVFRSSNVQDAGLAALLLAGTWALGGAAAAHGGWFAEAAWSREPVVRWVLIGVSVAAVAVRRRWPVPAFAAAVPAVLAEMALALGPVPADLAAPIVLYTVAVHRRRRVSLAVLGAALAVTVAWSAYAALDRRTVGWAYTGPFGVGGQESPAQAPGTRQDDPVFPAAPARWGGMLVLGGLLSAAWAVGWGVRSRRAYLGELRARARDAERERDQQAALAVAAERARLTREVHDVVAHGLAVIVMQAQGGAAAFDRRPADTLAALDTIVATGRASLADIRQVLSASGHGDDPAGPVPGLADLPRLVDRVRQAGTPVELVVDGTPRPLPAGLGVSSYRIVQEALTNTMKHAGPGARARVVVTYRGDELRLDVGDDGTAGPVSGGGNGLRGMRERAALLGGELTAGPAPGGGFAVRARIPLGAAGAA